MEDKEYKKIVMQVSITTILLNCFLAIFKCIAGIITKSGAMISDSIHSASDVFSTFIVMISIKLAKKEADSEHPYGHERIESIASFILAGILILLGVSIGINGIKQIVYQDFSNSTLPQGIALGAAISSIILKEGMYWYTRKYAKRIHSDALMADAWHHRSDSLSSIGSFIGIVGTMMGYPIMDSIACIIICLFIMKAGYDIAKDSIDKLIDKSCDPEKKQEIEELAKKQEGVLGVENIKTRLFGPKIYVDMDMLINKEESLENSYKIAREVHNAIEKTFQEVKHCNVNIKPVE